MSIIQDTKFFVSNIDKKETVELESMPVLCASANWIEVTKRGTRHDNKAIRSKMALESGLQITGFFGLISPRSELTELLNKEGIQHSSRFGSWFADRIIMFRGSTHQNPYSTQTNSFVRINNSTLTQMGSQIAEHLNILA